MRRTDTALSVRNDVFICCHTVLGEDFPDFIGCFENGDFRIGHEVRPFEMDRARYTTTSRAASLVFACPFVVGADIEDNRVLVIYCRDDSFT